MQQRVAALVAVLIAHAGEDSTLGAPSKNEPSVETFAAIGRLCSAWSYVEQLTEHTLWGLLRLNAEQARAFVWRMQLPQRWQMIVREASRQLHKDDVDQLRLIKKLVDATQRDRNIVVHGVIHAIAELSSPPPGKYEVFATSEKPPVFARLPCWTIYIGDDAGKNFPVSTAAVETILNNAHKASRLIQEFNKKKGFTSGTELQETVEENWPERL